MEIETGQTYISHAWGDKEVYEIKIIDITDSIATFEWLDGRELEHPKLHVDAIKRSYTLAK